MLVYSVDRPLSIKGTFAFLKVFKNQLVVSEILMQPIETLDVEWWKVAYGYIVCALNKHDSHYKIVYIIYSVRYVIHYIISN